MASGAAVELQRLAKTAAAKTAGAAAEAAAADSPADPAPAPADGGAHSGHSAGRTLSFGRRRKNKAEAEAKAAAAAQATTTSPAFASPADPPAAPTEGPHPPSGPHSGTPRRTLSFERTRRRAKEVASEAGAGGLRVAAGAASLLSRATHARKSDHGGATSENP